MENIVKYVRLAVLPSTHRAAKIAAAECGESVVAFFDRLVKSEIRRLAENPPERLKQELARLEKA